MQLLPGKFGTLTIVLELALIVIYAFFVDYGEEAIANTRPYNKTKDEKLERNVISQYYPMFQDVSVMIFVGFGFLMTFLKRYGYSAVGLNMFLAAISIQFAIIMQGIWNIENGKIRLSIINLMNGNFAAATVLISFGALLGKTSPVQMLIMTIIEIALFSCNEYLGTSVFKAADIGGSIFVHTYGAYFGLSVSYVLYNKDWKSHSKEGSCYHSDIFSIIGTLFLWMFWPSFNSALATGNDQHRAVINTYAALISCCIVTFAISSFVDKEEKFNMVHIQNATCAGGVAVGSTANMMLHPFGALIVGVVAGTVSTLGFRFLLSYLLKKFRIHDTCGVNNLHGMPGIISGLTSVIISSLASESEYGVSLYKLYPGRSPIFNSTEFAELKVRLKDLTAGEGWTAEEQALKQLSALFATLAVAVCGGIFTGYIIRHPFFNQPKDVQLFDDNDFWDVPDEDH